MSDKVVAGLDVGTECVKALVLAEGRKILGRSVVPTRGFFQDRAHEALSAALDEAGVRAGDLAATCATGFGAQRAIAATRFAGESACHVRGAFHHSGHAMTVVDVGGREPKVIHCDEQGNHTDSHAVRRCAQGIGTFLMFAARHLDVHPTRLEELAASAEDPATIGSYCSVLAASDILERLREGATRAEIALGCVHSIAERIYEVGGFVAPLVVTGGVVEYFPGVLRVLSTRIGMPAQAIPEPINAGALGAAILAWETANEEKEGSRHELT